jgi:hypothetical protein
MSVFVWWGEMAIQIHHCLEVNQESWDRVIYSVHTTGLHFGGLRLGKPFL